MPRNILASAIGATLLLTLAACGGGSGGTSASSPAPVTPTTAPVAVLLSDATSEDWATIAVKVLSITLTPQGGGAPVTVYSAPATAPMVNLVQLDQLSELLGNVQIPVGTYAAATLTLSANPGDVTLTTSNHPSAGFAAPANTTIPGTQVQIQGTSGATGSLVVPLTVNLAEPLTVNAGGSNALDLEFELGHPAFLVASVPAGGGTTLWAVNFSGPVHQHPIHSLANRILRHAYGTVASVSSDNASITITKDLPTIPFVSPETAQSTGQPLTLLADATNGSIYYDVDARTRAVIKDFSSIAGTIDGKFVRVAARYQSDGSLVVTRLWAGSTFNSVWLSPEGHVLGVDTNANTLTVTSESGAPVVLGVDGNTEFVKGTKTLGTGTSFLANLVRGFKVHVSVADPLATPLLAQTVEVETARFDGLISAADANALTYTRRFANPAADYTRVLPYISAGTANGTDANGAAITGFKWWNFAYPTQVTFGADAIGSFVQLSTGSVDFGGTIGPVRTYGTTFATWGDPSAPAAWSAPWVVVQPAPLPLATVTSGLDASNAFTMTALRGTNAVTVDVSVASGSATLAYQIDRSGGSVSVSPIDLTTPAGLATLTRDLAQGAYVKVGGVPQPDGTIKAYTVAVVTGDPVSQ